MIQSVPPCVAEDSSGAGKLTTDTLFEMNDNINRLSMINVDARWAEFRDALKKLHRERIVLVHEMNQMSKTLLAAPEPDVNYGKLTARGPDLTRDGSGMIVAPEGFNFANRKLSQNPINIDRGQPVPRVQLDDRCSLHLSMMIASEPTVSCTI
jgi:hypothetical protein